MCYEYVEMHKEAIEYYEKAIKLKPNFAEAYYSLGVSYISIGMKTAEKEIYDKAIECFKKTIELKPDFQDAYYYLGVGYSEIGKYKKAINAYKKAIELNPDDADAHYKLGCAYFWLGDMDSAFEECHTLKKIDKKKADNLLTFIEINSTCIENMKNFEIREPQKK